MTNCFILDYKLVPTAYVFQQDVLYAPSSNMLEEKTILEEHHTQFLLVDNGTVNQF